MNQVSFSEALTGVKAESPAERDAREISTEKAREAIFAARIVFMSSWLMVVIAALVIVFGVSMPLERVFNPWPAVGVGLVFSIIALLVSVGAFGNRRQR